MQLNNPIFINQTDADIRYVNTTGDTINGNIAINGNLNAGNSILGIVNNELKRVTNPQLNVTTITANNLVYNTGSQNISGSLTVNNGSLTVNGNLNSAGNYYVKVARLSDQTIPQNLDTNIEFSTITDPNNWYNPSTYRITPTISGNYCANLMVSWKQGSAPRTIQTNIQLRKAGNVFAITQVPVESGLNFSVYACGITTLNGTASDYIEATAYTSNSPNQNIVGEAVGAWTKMEVFKLN